MFDSARTAAVVTRGSWPRSSGCSSGTASAAAISPSSSAALRCAAHLFDPIERARRLDRARARTRRMIAVARVRAGVSGFRLEVGLQRVGRRRADARADVGEQRALPPSAISPSISAVSTNGAVLTTPSSATRLPWLATAVGVRRLRPGAR